MSDQTGARRHQAARVCTHALTMGALGALAAGCHAHAPSPQAPEAAPAARMAATRPTTAPRQAPSAAHEPFTAEERQRIAHAVMHHPEVTEATKGHRVRTLRVEKAALNEKEARPATVPGGEGAGVARVTVLDYTTGKAMRYRLDPPTGRMLSKEELPGRPEPSPEEIAEAKLLIAADPVLGPMIHAGSVIEGGFSTDEPTPPGAVVMPPHTGPATGGAAAEGAGHRYLQFQILSPDRKTIRHAVVVDLAENRVAASVGTGDGG